MNKFLFKMKRIKSKLFLDKMLFTYIKGHLYLIKGHLDDPEGQVWVESVTFEKGTF